MKQKKDNFKWGRNRGSVTPLLAIYRKLKLKYDFFLWELIKD